MQFDRIRALSSDLYDNAFQILDAEFDVSGEQAGFVAEAVQRAFEYACLRDDCDAIAGRIILDAQRDGTLEYTCEALEEDSDPADWCDIGADSIIADLAGGNIWAWCTIKMTCKVPSYSAVGTDYLSCCSYASRDDFESTNDYYDDMRTDARDALQSALRDELEKSAGAVKPF